MLLESASSKHLIKLCDIESEVESPRVLAILKEAGIPCLIKQFASQMGMRYGILGMTTIYVEARNLKRSVTILEDAKAIKHEPEVEPQEVEASGTQDDLQPLRRERRYLAARLLTYAYSAALMLSLVPSLDLSLSHFLSLSALPCILIGLAIWSRSEPEKGFAALLLLYAGLCSLGMMIYPKPLLAPGFLVLLSVYFAYKTAVETTSSPAS